MREWLAQRMTRVSLRWLHRRYAHWWDYVECPACDDSMSCLEQGEQDSATMSDYMAYIVRVEPSAD
jgi:hypothetical protein